MKKASKSRSTTVKETRSTFHVTTRTRTRTATAKVDLAIPAAIFESSRQLAQKLDMPLGDLYAAALKAYVEAHQVDSITERLNQVYATESSELDPALVQLQIALLAGEAW
jgi:hypothetical protein